MQNKNQRFLTILLDVENGYDYSDGSNRPYGVHLEFDLAKGKLIRALPFGYLSFPKRYSSSQH